MSEVAVFGLTISCIIWFLPVIVTANARYLSDKDVPQKTEVNSVHRIESDNVLNLEYHRKYFNDNGQKNQSSSNSRMRVSFSSLASHRNQIAKKNLIVNNNKSNRRTRLAAILSENLWASPGNVAKQFTLPTLNGTLSFPGTFLNESTPILIHSYNPHSGFLNCMWNCSGTMKEFVKQSPNDTQYIFISNSNEAHRDILWMRDRLKKEISEQKRFEMLGRLHFVTVPLYDLGTWIQELLWLWSCPDHNCGLDQVLIKDDTLNTALVVKRLDARYDWLPSPMVSLGNRTLKISLVSDGGCHPVPNIKDTVVMTTTGGCSYYSKISAMQSSGAVAVLLIQTDPDGVVQDMNCEDEQCATSLTIPASMLPYNTQLLKLQNATVKFQNSPSENYFVGIYGGRLAEVGWFLYPSFSFLSWQAQWFRYSQGLERHLAAQTDVLTISVFNDSVMHGSTGATANVSLPTISELQGYSEFELDLSMSCPGSLDRDCPHWDHTVQLYVCCDVTSDLCGMELGRWISPFRRRIGRWVTSVHSLLPLLTSSQCLFTLKTAPWALPWQPSLTLRFSGIYHDEREMNGKNKLFVSDKSTSSRPLYPYLTLPLYQPSFNFDRNYNKHFTKKTFSVPVDAKKVELVSVITGHGSDEHGCGEFCVTSHHFVVNGRIFNKTFDIAGSPLGCAERVPYGVEPNEHGTWLYGRDGWCDGQQVSPWVIDITSEVITSDIINLTYFGWYNGTDPDPKANPGIMIFSSYVTYYR